jgi:hypothetical protein
MALTWQEVSESGDFKSLSAAEQAQAREQYWREVVEPQVPAEMRTEARKQFDADTYIRKQDLPPGVTPSQAGAGRGVAPGAGVPPEPTAPRRGTMRAVRPFGAGDARVPPPPPAAAPAAEIAPEAAGGMSPEWGGFDQTPEPADPRPLLERPLPDDLQNDPGVRRAQGIDQSRSPAAAAASRRDMERRGAQRRADQQFRDEVEATREGLGRAGAPLGDVGTAAAKGVYQTAGLAVDALRMLPLGEAAGDALTSLSTWTRLSAEAAQRAKSPESRAQWRELQTILQDDNASMATVLGFLVANPGIAVEGGAESASTMVPVIGAGKLGGDLAGLLARRLAANPATAATARELGAAAGVMGSNAAMGAGSVYAEALRNGSSQADALSAAGGTALAYALAGRLTRGGAEGALVSGRGGSVLTTTGREMAQEGLESLGESAGAAMTPEQDFDPGQAARQATFEAALAAGPGAAAGLIAATPYERARAVGFNVDPPLTTDTPQAQRRKIDGVFDDIVAAHPIGESALQAVRNAAKTVPLSKLGRFYSGFVAALQKRGVASADIAPEALEALAAGPVDPPQEAPSTAAPAEVAPKTAPAAAAPDEALPAADLVPPDATDPGAEADMRAPGALPESAGAQPAQRMGAPEQDKIEAAASTAATSPLNDLPEPTDAQKEAGNYKVGKVRISGLDVSIENPRGSIRRSKADATEPWEVEMPAHYGYIRGTKGADGDHVDLFVGAQGDNGRFWVINQKTPDGEAFDEHKVITGVGSEAEAVEIYKASFADGFGDRVFDSITDEMSADELRELLPAMSRPKPIAGRESRRQEREDRTKAEALIAKADDEQIAAAATRLGIEARSAKSQKALLVQRSQEDPKAIAEALVSAAKERKATAVKASMQAKIVALRKRRAVIRSLLECMAA